MIQAGIAAQQAPAAQQLIEAQVQALAAGDFDVATLAKVKAGLLNQYLASQDDENYLLGRAPGEDPLAATSEIRLSGRFSRRYARSGGAIGGPIGFSSGLLVKWG